MREIKFRAKVLHKEGVIYLSSKYKDGDWVFGEPHVNCRLPHIHIISSYKEPIYVDTLSQFAGLKDKNGKDIYEGDIITVNRSKKTKGFLYVVTWERHGWLARPILKDATPSLVLQFYNEFDEKKIEVIGNIYDNKELLSEK